MKKVLLTLGIAVAFAAAAAAQSTPHVNQRQVHQTQRIQEGVQSGDLTRREARILAAQQRHVQHQKQAAKADGVVTSRERRHIRQDQRVASRSIARMKHNERERF
jgi:uncharacterized membrane protein YebE (DUF533 family)